MTEYQPKYQWHRTQIDENDPPRETDWTGMDGPMYIGRIRKETHGPTKGKWHWGGSWPKTFKGAPPTPNAGYQATARLATQKVEEHWELSMRVMTPHKTKGSQSPTRTPGRKESRPTITSEGSMDGWSLT